MICHNAHKSSNCEMTLGFRFALCKPINTIDKIDKTDRYNDIKERCEQNINQNRAERQRNASEVKIESYTGCCNEIDDTGIGNNKNERQLFQLVEIDCRKNRKDCSKQKIFSKEQTECHKTVEIFHHRQKEAIIEKTRI